MATYQGAEYGERLLIDQPTNVGYGYLTEHTPGILETSYSNVGVVTDTQPIIAQPADIQIGNYLAAYGFLDFYNRIHISPLSIDLGSVVSAQERAVSVFNAYFVERTLNDVIAFNDDGLTLTEPAATPLNFAPLQELFYEIAIATEGPAVIAASYTFDFDVVDIDVEITGIRIVAWQWEPNWLNPIIERLQWNTDVMESYDGSEQRIALRGAPRVQWEFTFDVADDLRRLLENVLSAWGGRIWALPIWIDVGFLSEPLVFGSTSIAVDTAGKDFHVGGIALIIGSDGGYESFEVAAVAGDMVTAADPIANTWPAGSRVYPARTARLLNQRGYGRFHRNYVRGLARFQTVEEIVRSAATETLYRDYPVMEREPNWRDAPDIDYARKLASIDFGTGKEFSEDEAECSLPSQSFRWTMLDRDEADYFREWAYARRGRQRGIWLPTWSDDLIMASTLASSSINIDFAYAGLVHFGGGDIHRRDIRIELVNGTIYYRRVTTPVTVDASTERMTMNAIIGLTLEPSDILRISWMHFVRLDTDDIELTWQTPAVAEAAILTKGARNEF